jgi:YfiH family protein
VTGPATHLQEQHTNSGGLERYELDAWLSAYGVTAGVTARAPDPDMSVAAEPLPDSVRERWLLLTRVVGDGFRAVVVGRQVHGARLQVTREAEAGIHVLDEIDGHLTDGPGLLLAVTLADCVPVYLLEAERGTMGLVHAGWRGIAGGVFETGVGALCELAECSPASIVMHCGVSVCGDCYEVGPEVFEAVAGERPAAPGRLDLRDVLRIRAEALGIGQLTASPWCSVHDHDRFHSHRASGGAPGRMAAYLGRPTA